jgi:hypothetical protein
MLLDKLIPRNWKQSKRNRDPFTGDVKIGQYSSLRKLARAMRRGKVPDERQVIMNEAIKSARRYGGQGHVR